MNYGARPQATLVDLLDRILDRGLVINADIVISLAGVPLIALNLRAALAGMETMVKYGFMQEGVHSVRSQEEEWAGQGSPPADEAAPSMALQATGT